MIALDTNVLVRYLVRDDPAQAEAARKLVASLTRDSPGFIGREVVVELVWVLTRSYGTPREQIATVLLGLLGSESIVIESANDVGRAALGFARGVADFADLMVVAAARRQDATPLYTFDHQAARMDGVELLSATSKS